MCQKKSILPDDIDKPWVLKYQIEYLNEINGDHYSNDVEKVISNLTIKRLLFNGTLSNKIHADATYKLIWQGFPCFLIRTTDIIKQLHRYGIAVCLDEKDFEFIFISIRDGLRHLNGLMNEHNLVLIADSSDPIRNAFQKKFGKYHNMVMCWAHMRKCLIKKFYLTLLPCSGLFDPK